MMFIIFALKAAIFLIELNKFKTQTMSNTIEENQVAAAEVAQEEVAVNWLDEPFVPDGSCKAVYRACRDIQADFKKGIAVNAYKSLVRSHDDMDLIHNPRNYTRHQNNLMTVLVGYVWN